MDDYKYIDPSKPGERKVNSRMRNVYDQSQQVAYNPGRPGHFNTWWLAPAAAVTFWDTCCTAYSTYISVQLSVVFTI